MSVATRLLFAAVSPLFAMLAARAGEVPVAAVAPTVRPQVVIETSLGTIRAELFADEAPLTVANFIELAEGAKEFTDPTSGAKAKRPFYDGLIFHRVIKGFMIQGGDPLGTGMSGPGYTFADEINAHAVGIDGEMVILAGDQPNPQCGYMMQDFMRAVLMPKLAARGITDTSTPAEREQAFTAVMPELRGVTLQQFYQLLGYHYDEHLPGSHKPLRGSLAMANSGPGTNGSQFFINLRDTPHLTGKHTVFGQVVAGMEVVDAIGDVPVAEGDKPATPVVITSIRRQQVPGATPKTEVPAIKP